MGVFLFGKVLFDMLHWNMLMKISEGKMTKKEVRRQIKAQAKERMAGNWIYLILITLPAVIFSWIGNQSYSVTNVATSYATNWSDGHASGTLVVPSLMNVSNGTIMSLLAFIAGTAAMYSLLDFYRSGEKQAHPFLQSINAYKQKGLFWGTIGVAILQFIWTFLWTLLLFIPGIIKGLAYSQAFFVFKDAKAAGEDIRFRDAITRSRQLMDGHKWEYFVLILSFIGWGILAELVFGLGMVILLPYMYLTYAGFYDYLKKDLAEKNGEVA
ncbi:hypothetical protein FFRU_090640 [Fructobacillus fructosus]|nr:hypothetical protein IV71_GL001457 [Fructobacillus fructosus KCTC 3544]GAP01586.1 hypothetical protein FFRU_090640 [Fructobacillus fructosus]